jgi:hypothetical protein
MGIMSLEASRRFALALSPSLSEEAASQRALGTVPGPRGAPGGVSSASDIGTAEGGEKHHESGGRATPETSARDLEKRP